MADMFDGLKNLFRQKSTAAPKSESKPGIEDAEGRPVDTTVLAEEHAAPTVSGMRPVLAASPVGNLDPSRLATILRSAAEGDADAYLELAEEMEEKYLHYAGQLATRKRAVTRLDITVEAASDEAADVANADLVREFLERDTVDAETFDILDHLGKGYSVTELIWETSVTPWLPRLKTRDPRFFEYDRYDLETLRLKGGPDGGSGLAQDLAPYKYIVHQSAAKTGLAIRGGLARAVAWAYLFQNMSLKDWVIFAEVYGMPIRIGKYDANATDDQRRTLLRAVMSIATDAAAIIPKSMEVEFVNGMASGNPDVYEKLCRYLDEQVSKLVVGQTGTADATTGGFGSSGQVHAEVRDDIRDSDAKALAATLNRDLVRPIIDLNYGPPKSGKYPRIRIGQAEQFTKEDLEILEGLVGMGVEIEMSVVRDKAGYADPAEKTKDGQPVKLLKAPGSAAPDSASEDQSQTPAQKPPQEPQEPGTAPTASKTPASASVPALKRLKPALETAPTPASGLFGADPIDALVDAGADHWVPVVAPLIDGLDDLLAASSSLTDFRDRLIGHIGSMDDGALTDLLARSMYTARLAGEAGER